MPKDRFDAKYTVQGEEGVRSKGGSDRRKAVADMVKSVGGELTAFTSSSVTKTFFQLSIFPTTRAAAAVALIANAAGGATVKTTVLLTPNR